MISTDFASNEFWDDAWVSLKLLLQPWRWKIGVETELVKKEIKKIFGNMYHLDSDRTKMIHLFLSGRSALFYLLKSLKLPKNAEVMIQAFTCEAVVLPILANNLKPIYIDIESDTYSMNYRELTNRLTDNCRVLILQHTFGLTPKFRNEILKLTQERKLIIIEDLAHGFSNNLTMKQSNNSFILLSFGRSKLLSSVFGGAIISSNKSAIQQYNNLPYPSFCFIFRCLLYKPLTMLIKTTYEFFYLGKIFHKILNKVGLLIPEITSKEKRGEYDELLNKAYPNALVALLLHQLNKFEQIQKQRARICKIYKETISKQVSNYQLLITNYTSLIRFPLLVNNRDEIIKKARDRSIFHGTWYDQVVAPKDLDLGRVEYKLGSCPKAEEICEKIINLPTNIKEEEAKRIVNILNDVK